MNSVDGLKTAPAPSLPLTIFAMPKAFRGHFAIIQKNAITSWTHLRPKVEIILCGDDAGTPEIARELGLRHIGDIARNPSGTPRLDDLFAKAEDAVPQGLLCYVNADIMLMDDFPRAARRLAGLSPLMMVGRRWNMIITEPWDFQAADWQARLAALVRAEGIKDTANAIDYFLFSKGLGRNLLPLAIGRTLWDNWLVWNALKQGAAIVDATDVVTAVHQAHDYSHHPAGTAGVWHGEEAKLNRKLIGDTKRLLTLDDVRYRLTPDGIERCHRHIWRSVAYAWRHPGGFAKFSVRSMLNILAKRSS